MEVFMTIRNFILIAAWLTVGLPLGGEVKAQSPDEGLMTAIRFPEAIHFYAPDETDVVVVPGLYQVSRIDDGLRLVNLSDNTSITLKAWPGRHEESLQESVAVTVYGDVVNEPDISVLTLMLPDGTQLSAEGSYSGIRPRGLRDRLRAARAKIQQAASQARAKMEALKRQVQILVDLRRQAKAMPALSPAERTRLNQQAKTIREQNMGLIQEIQRRVRAQGPLLTGMKRKGIQNLSKADIETLTQKIFGTGASSLRLSGWPKENVSTATGQPVPRGGGRGSSYSIGFSADAAASFGPGIGGGVGAGVSWAIAPAGPTGGATRFYGIPGYLSWSVSAGYQLDASGNLDVGFFHSWPTELGGCDYAVEVAGGLVGGAGVAVVFQGKPGTDFQWSGLVISPGAEAGVSAAIVAGCARQWMHL